MRGFIGFFRGTSQSSSSAVRRVSASRRLVLETLESRLTPSAATDLQVNNLYRVLLER
jgi:hypothetical protein